MKFPFIIKHIRRGHCLAGNHASARSGDANLLQCECNMPQPAAWRVVGVSANFCQLAEVGLPAPDSDNLSDNPGRKGQIDRLDARVCGAFPLTK